MLCDNNSLCVLLSRLNQSTDLLDVVRLICKWPPMRKDPCWVQMVFMAVMSLLAVANYHNMCLFKLVLLLWSINKPSTSIGLSFRWSSWLLEYLRFINQLETNEGWNTLNKQIFKNYWVSYAYRF